MLVCIPSDRPERLRKTLLNVFDRLKEESVEAEVLAVDGSDELEKNREFAAKVSVNYGASVQVVPETEYAAKNAEYAFLFSGPYGGPRNVGLAEACRRKQNLVYLDDDVIPLDGFFKKFESLLEKHAIVVGAYAGRRTGAAFLLDKANHAIDDFIAKKTSREEALRRCSEAFSGWSDDWPPSVEGFRGGSLGVSVKAAEKYCFFPTKFRVEDGMYCELAKYFIDEEPFSPFLNEAPVGFHKPETGDLFTLPEYYLSSIQGSAIGLSIRWTLQHFGKTLDKKQVAMACEKGPAQLFSEFSEQKVRERNEKNRHYAEAFAQLGDKKLLESYKKFADTSLEEVKLPDLPQQVERFFKCQTAWPEFTSKQ